MEYLLYNKCFHCKKGSQAKKSIIIITAKITQLTQSSESMTITLQSRGTSKCMISISSCHLCPMGTKNSVAIIKSPSSSLNILPKGISIFRCLTKGSSSIIKVGTRQWPSLSLGISVKDLNYMVLQPFYSLSVGWVGYLCMRLGIFHNWQ